MMMLHMETHIKEGHSSIRRCGRLVEYILDQKLQIYEHCSVNVMDCQHIKWHHCVYMEDDCGYMVVMVVNISVGMNRCAPGLKAFILSNFPSVRHKMSISSEAIPSKWCFG